MRTKIIKKIILGLAIVSLANCSNYSYDNNDTSSANSAASSGSNSDELSLTSLRNLNQGNIDNVQSSDSNTTIRDVALYEMALSMGMRGGLYNRSNEINGYLAKNTVILDRVFDFRDLMLPNKIIPPVLIEAQKSMSAEAHEPLPTDEDSFLLNDNPTGKHLAEAKVRAERAQNNFRTLRITDRLYKILKQARFGVTVPGWNDYIQMSFSKPLPPEAAILPKNSAEQEVWQRGVSEGWQLGYAQADQIFMQNLLLLKRDYLGMLRYKKLLAMNMVSEPYVAKRDYGVTGDGDEIKINDRVLTIAALPALNPDSKNWKPYLLQDQEQELEAKIAALDLDGLLKYLPPKNGKGVINSKEKFKK